MKEIMNKRLSLFWNSAMFILSEWEPSAVRTADFSKFYDDDAYIKINNNQAYGLYFTPNGNFGNLNTVWEKIVRAKTDGEEYISSLYIDVDMRASDYTDMDRLLKNILETVEIDWMPIQYIVQTGNGYHLYMFIKEEYRRIVAQEFGNKFREIQENLAKNFEWWDTRSHSINKLMRMPFSKYWRTIPAKTTKLFKVIWEDRSTKLEEITSTEQITLDDSKCLTLDMIQYYCNNISEVSVKKQKSQEYIWDIGSSQINIIPITEVINKLKWYPREHMWKTYEFWLKNSRIILKIDWQTYVPDGYKVNIANNYVHNFSLDQYNVDERPRWPVFPFLYNYFKKDITQLNKFLTDEFQISLMKWWWDDENYICLPTETWYIYFTDKWVLYGKSVFNKKAKTYEDVQIKLFDSPIYIKWIIKTDYDLFWETEEKNVYYLFYNAKTWTDIIIEYTSDRKAFNKKYWKKGLIFFGSEYDLLDFYNTINHAADNKVVKEFDFRYLNGWYKDWFVIWDKIYDRNAEEIDYNTKDIILKTNNIARTFENKDVSLMEFGDKLCKVCTNRVAMIWLTTFVALFLWHKFRTPILWKYKQQVLMPWLFFSWVTKSGKSTILTILKNAAEITLEARKYSVIWTSPQPLKQAATDDFILHLEEFTGMIWDQKETIIRDILNKARTARWMADGWNTYYIFRSSLLLDWEHMPKSASVANRCVVVPMFDTPEEKIGNEKTLADMIGLSFLKDIIKKSYEYTSADILDVFKKSEQTLLKFGITDRRLLLYTFILTVNRVFNIFLEDELLKAISENIEMIDSIEKTNNILGNILSELIIKNKIIPTISKNDSEWFWQITVPYTMELRSQNLVLFIDIAKQYPNHIKVIWNNINIKLYVDETGVLATDKANVDIYNTIVPYKTYFKQEHFLNFIESA